MSPKRRGRAEQAAPLGGAGLARLVLAAPAMSTIGRSTLPLAAVFLGCTHVPRRAAEPMSGQAGCYEVRAGPWSPADVPVAISLERLPSRVALVVDRESGDDVVDPGWRLAALESERDRAMRSIQDGAWWPLENGGLDVRLGDGFSGIFLRLRPSVGGFVGEARTYQDVGDASWHAPAELKRRACDVEPKVIDRYRDRRPPPSPP